MNTGPGGFGNAPITKLVFLGTTCSSLVQQVARASSRKVPFVIHLFTKAFVFQHPGELLFGSILLYHFRLFERQLGSAKYGAFLAVAGTACKLLEVALGRLGGLRLPTGPYGIIFANFVNFLLDVPSTQRFSVFGWPMTDKAFIYLAVLQLSLSSPRGSMAAAVAGFIGGLVYRTNIFGCRRWKLPSWFTQLFESASSAMPRTGHRPSAGGRAGAGAPAGATPAAAAGMAGGGGPLMAPGAGGSAAGGGIGAGGGGGGGGGGALPEASPEALEQLIAMGFDRTQAAAALQQVGNNVQDALALLL